MKPLNEQRWTVSDDTDGFKIVDQCGEPIARNIRCLELAELLCGIPDRAREVRKITGNEDAFIIDDAETFEEDLETVPADTEDWSDFTYDRVDDMRGKAVDTYKGWAATRNDDIRSLFERIRRLV
jgi:hypothetical protein